MYLIHCPHCGPRAQSEFTFDRPVEAIVQPDADAATALHALYTRTNPMGVDDEVWRHTYGCRSWLALTRDRVSHAILAVRAFGPEVLP
jgi:heterotetrameric sarcosine oxidase delta subunit